MIRLGSRIHEKSGREFFTSAAETLKVIDQPGPHLAYLYGFLCHFALDRRCHAYISRFIEESGGPHLDIEAELDRYYLLKDGKDPFREILTRHVVPRDRNARVISDFFPPEITSDVILQSMKDFVLYLNILVCRSSLKRRFLLFALEKAGHKDFQGLIIRKEPIPACEKSNEDLAALYEASLPDAVKLISNFLPEFVSGSAPDELYDYNFEGEKVST